MNTRHIVQRFKSDICSLLGQDLVSLYWFGSTARGEISPNADIDLLIETQGAITPQERNQIADIAIDICAEYGILLDIHYYTTDEMKSSPYSYSPLLQSVENEGIRA